MCCYQPWLRRGLLSFFQCVAGMILSTLSYDYIVDTSLHLEKREQIFRYYGTFTRASLTMFEILFGNFGPPARVLVENVSEWFALFFLGYRCVFLYATLNVINAVPYPALSTTLRFFYVWSWLARCETDTSNNVIIDMYIYIYITYTIVQLSHYEFQFQLYVYMFKVHQDFNLRHQFFVRCLFSRPWKLPIRMKRLPSNRRKKTWHSMPGARLLGCRIRISHWTWVQLLYTRRFQYCDYLYQLICLPSFRGLNQAIWLFWVLIPELFTEKLASKWGCVPITVVFGSEFFQHQVVVMILMALQFAKGWPNWIVHPLRISNLYREPKWPLFWLERALFWRIFIAQK